MVLFQCPRLIRLKRLLVGIEGNIVTAIEGLKLVLHCDKHISGASGLSSSCMDDGLSWMIKIVYA